jgi:hypothetical protein
MGRGFVGNQALATFAVLRPEIKDTFLCTGFEGNSYMFVPIHLVGVHCV